VHLASLEDLPTRPITEFGSERASVTHIARGEDVDVVRIEIEAGGRLGMHLAGSPQLLIVVKGEGTVVADGGTPARVAAGTSVWWRKGELHETRSETGLTAIVVQASSLDVTAGPAAADASASA
jgi:quercetin dioxygenase-like cupin family protein